MFQTSLVFRWVKEFYDDRIRNIIVTNEVKKQKEIADCYNKLNCFIVDYGIKRFEELMKEDKANSGFYADQMLQLKRELIMIKKEK